jgi:hypothetical protein
MAIVNIDLPKQDDLPLTVRVQFDYTPPRPQRLNEPPEDADYQIQNIEIFPSVEVESLGLEAGRGAWLKPTDAMHEAIVDVLEKDWSILDKADEEECW